MPRIAGRRHQARAWRDGRRQSCRRLRLWRRWQRLVAFPPRLWRSEEHTSELQSRSDLVCRLLLEKKKKIHTRSTTQASTIRITLLQPFTTMKTRAATQHTAVVNAQSHTTYTTHQGLRESS